MRDIKNDPAYQVAQSQFDEECTWEYNLQQQVRWDTEDAPSDMCFYIKAWFEKIAEQEGYELVKK